MAPSISTATVEPLRQPILNILRTSDLSVISAKKVRVALQQVTDARDPSRKLIDTLGVQLDVKEHKGVVDTLIRECFDQVNSDVPATTSHAGQSGHSKNGGVHHNGSSTSSGGAPSAPKIALPGMGGVPGSHVASANSTSSSSNSIKTTTTSSVPTGVKRKPKNDDIVSEDEDDDIEAVKRKAVAAKKSTNTVKKKRKAATDANGEKKPPNPNNPFNKPVILSAEMSKLCGASEVSMQSSNEADHVLKVAQSCLQMPRYAITKALWAYIKERDLQNPSNKRQVSSSLRALVIFTQTIFLLFQQRSFAILHLPACLANRPWIRSRWPS